MAETKKKSQGAGTKPAPPTSTKPARYTPVDCSLKYNRKYLLPGDKSDLADLSKSELKGLLEAGKIKKV